ncbi:MAG: branched-chain amino acid ABC transporter substrate-binding protein [Elusimicrobiota bacterium]|jgi:branched-chain amino acid transport system substrate-binding protein
MKKVFCGLLALAILAGCGPKEKVARIAVALPLTGDIAALGQGLKRACTLALEESAQNRHSTGFRVEIKTFDDRSDPKEAVDVANRIVSDASVVAVIGHFNSGCSLPASLVYARHHLAMISPAASNPKLTLQQLDPSWRYPKTIFRVNTTDDIQGSYAGEFAVKTLKARRACIIHDKTAYGQGVAEEFRKRLEALGGTALSFDGVNVADKDFNALLTRLHELHPQMIYFGGDYAGGGLIVRQARGVGEKAPMVLSEANFDPEFLRVAGAAAEGCYVTFLGSPTSLLPSARRFVDAYRARYPGVEVKAYDGYGYEAMAIVLSLIEKVGPDRVKILAALPSVAYQGVLGETRFDQKGDTLNHRITLFQVKDGQFQPVK